MRLTGQQGTRIPSLDGLRALSIVLVLLGHGGDSIPFASKVPIWASVVLENSGFGVFVFFVISGFLITSLLIQERSKSGTISIKNFYIRRAFRIWPAFYVLIAVVALLGLTHRIPLRLGELLAAALYFWNYYPAGATWYLGHTWSLAIEEQFYFFWPLTVRIIGNSRAAYFAIGTIAFSPLIRVASYFLLPQSRPYIPIMLHTRADALMFGAAAALLYQNVRFQQLLKICFRSHLPVFAGIFAFLISPQLARYWRGSYQLTIGWTLEGMAVMLMMIWAVQHHTGLIGRILNSRLAVHIGLISYSLYLWQQVFLAHSTAIIHRFPLNFILAFVAAELSYRLVEQPFLKMRARISENRTRKTVLQEVSVAPACS